MSLYERLMAEQRHDASRDETVRLMPRLMRAVVLKAAGTIDLFHFGTPSVPQKVGGW